MKIFEYKKEIHRITNLIVVAEKSDDEIQALLSQYICVLTSGLLENAIREILERISTERSAPEITNFVVNSIQIFRNPKIEKIENLFNMFNDSWNKELASLIDEKMQDAVNSVVNNRNNIAHGRPTGISLGVMKRYFKDVVKYVEVLELYFF